MNILTKNRILQAGDEYKSGSEWKPILPKDIGMQILFTTYKEVRRPSEAPYTPPTPKPKPISPDSPDSAKAGGIAKAESENITLVPTHSGTGVTPTINRDIPVAEIKLPTVISAKAHERKHVISDEEAKETTRAALAAVVKLPKTVFPPGTPARGTPKHPMLYETIIDYEAPASTPHPATRPPKWIGRNGTFTARGLKIRVGKGGFNDGVVGLVPVGKRGLAKNALIEFPVEIIPHIIAFLEKHRPPK